MTLLGLKDDYVVDGRVLVEVLDPSKLPPTAITPQFLELADVYKSINAPVGPLGLASLKYANASITSSDPSAYSTYLTTIGGITATRNNLSSQMITLLNNAAFNHQDIDPNLASSLITQGIQLLAQVQALAGPAKLASHDFNDDNASDVLWREAGGSVAMWIMSGAQVLSSGWIGGVPTTWSIFGQRDFNGDGKSASVVARYTATRSVRQRHPDLSTSGNVAIMGDQRHGVHPLEDIIRQFAIG